jgi:hypothetical protein
MQNSTASAKRRSSRRPANVDFGHQPRACCSFLKFARQVSAHGCSMRSPMKLDAGVLVHFHKEGRETTAKVVYCPAPDPSAGLEIGRKLDRPENWGLKGCPQDGNVARARRPRRGQLP